MSSLLQVEHLNVSFATQTGEVAAVPIIGWRVRNGDDAEPVFLGPRPQGHLFLHLSGNALLGTDRRFAELYPSLKAACAAVAAASANQEEAA